MEVKKIQKLQDKELVQVAGQENCSDINHTRVYVKGQDCLHDCTNANKKPYYKSQLT